MNTGKRILKNLFSLSVAEIAGKGLAFFYTIYLIRKIGPESNGILNFAKSIVQYFVILVTLGYEQVGIREVAKTKSLLKKYVDLITSIRLGVALLSYLLLYATVQLLSFGKPDIVENTGIIYIYGLTIFSTAFLLNWVFQAIEKMEVIAIRSVAVYLVNFIGILLFVKGSGDLTKAVIIISASMIINSIWMFYYYQKKINKFNLNFNFREWWFITKEAVSIGFIFLIATLYNNIDITMLGIIKGDFDTGIYAAGHQVIVFAILPSIIIQGAFFPQFALRQTFESRDFIISKFLKLQTFAGYLIFGLVFFFAEYSVLLLGNKYANSILILKFLSFTVLLQFLISVYFSPLISWKEEKKVIVANLAGLLVNVILNSILIPIYGMYGAAIATVFCELSVLITIIFIFKKVFGKVYLKEIFEFAPIMLAAFIPVFYLKDFINPIFSILISIALYVGISLAFKVIDFDEFKALLKK